MKFFLHAKFWLPVLLILLIELLFRLGVWESMASPSSHAGGSIQSINAALSYAPDSVSAVTLGNSRVMQGVDQAVLAQRLADHDKRMIRLARPGTHLLTLNRQSRWIKEHLPAVDFYLIGLSVTDFHNYWNGYYELAIAEPFKTPAERIYDNPFPNNFEDTASWKQYSALWLYRDDIKDYFTRPATRHRSLKWWQQRSPKELLTIGQSSASNICPFDFQSPERCTKSVGEYLEKPELTLEQRQAARRTLNTCQQQPSASGIQAARSSGKITEKLKTTRDLFRDFFQQTAQTAKVVLVLMPVHPFELNHGAEPGIEDWARDILQPLVNDGYIDIFDYTHFFAGHQQNQCQFFSDPLHLNQDGRLLLTRQLNSDIAEYLEKEGRSSEFQGSTETGYRKTRLVY